MFWRHNMERRKSGEGTIRLHENGLWEGRLIVKRTGYKPFIKYAYEDTYEKCEKRLQELKIENGVIDDCLYSPDMRFKDWVEIWLVYTAFKRSAETTHSYRSMLDNHVFPALGDRQIGKITTGVLERFYAELLKSGRLVNTELNGEGLSINMVRTIHKMIVAIFSTIVEHRFMKKNPGTKAKFPKVQVASKKIYSYEELRKILRAAKEVGLYELMLFALCTGMERAEICSLQWKDIVFKRKEVKVYQSLKYLHKEYYVEPSKKASQIRKIVLSDSLVKILKEYKKTSNSVWVFPSAYGNGLNPRSPNTLTVKFHQILKRAGISEGSFKALRDTYAVICLDNGMDIRTLSSVLGYDNARTVKNSYIQYMSTKKLIAANKMEGAMSSIKTLYG